MHVKYIKKDVIVYRMINIANGIQISKSANQFHARTYKVRKPASFVMIANIVMSVLRNVNTITINNFVKKINAIGILIIKNALNVILISAMILLVQIKNVAIIKKLLNMVKLTLFVFPYAKK